MSKIWEHNDCVVFYWDKEQQVVGLKVEKKGNYLSVIETAVSNMGHLALSLADVKNKLVKKETHLMLAGSLLPGSVSFDINLPKMSQADMRQAITYELPRHLPCEIQDVVFGYRMTGTKEEHNSGKQPVRIFAVMKKEWNELLSELTGSGLKIDSFLTPFLAIDPIFSEEDEIILKTDETTISFSRSSEFPGRRVILKNNLDAEDELNESYYKEKINDMGYNWSDFSSSIKESPETYFHPLLIASYGLTPEFASDKPSLIKLPPELIPERYRALKTSFFSLIAAILILVIMLIGRFWWESVSRYDSIQNEIKKINIENGKIKLKLKRLQSNADLIKEIKETQKGNAEVLTCFYKITQELSKGIWLGHFQTRDGTVRLTFRYTKSGLSIPNFNKMGIFKTLEARSDRNRSDGSVTESVKLQYISPEERNGKK